MLLKPFHGSSSATAQIHNHQILRPLPRPSFPFTNRSLSNSAVLFRSLSSPSYVNVVPSRIRRRFAVPYEGHEREVSSLEIEREVDDGLQANEQSLGNQGLLNQMKEIVTFTGPAIGLWICGPLMSLIDTAVIGQGSAVELAALGPATVLCDYTSYVFMFLSIATSNMVATAIAKQDKNEVQHHISILLFVGLTSGFFMLVATKLFGSVALTAFAGPKNADVIPAANRYIQIRGLAWPAVLTGWVAQSASLGMKDSWGPLKALAVASIVDGIGHLVLCTFLGYGIVGAAWSTMASQVIAAYMMVGALNKKGYSAYSPSVPSTGEFLSILGIAAPIFLTMMSKVVFYSLLIYYATSMGTHTMAAHQVMVQTFCMCTARMLLKSLLIIGAIFGLVLGTIGTSVPRFFPNLFTPEEKIIQEMHKVLTPYFLALVITPPTLCLEGTLLAGRDLKFISLSMCGCLSLGALLLLVISSRGYGLVGCWYALVGFQWARFLSALRRVLSPDGVLYSSDLSHYRLVKQKAA
ncbi:Protein DETOXIFICATION 46, chloroplastic, partial [Cucurbita argyrosperma subsp. sororia]